MSAPEGYLVVDKPPGMTSHDVVARLRHVLGERRVGHAGTLDPDATGVLVVGVGRATRLLRYAADLDKTYVAEIVLGVATSTLDSSGEVVATFDMSGVDPAAVRTAAESLTGELAQVPPMVSAVKVDGRRLYEFARAGVEVERAPRPVTVFEFALETTPSPTVYRARVRCSSGTYVRQLAADLGAALGGGAHLRDLRRLAIGPFRVEDACALEECSPQALRPPAGLVAHLETVVVTDPVAARIAHGALLETGVLAPRGAGPLAVVSGAGALLAVYARRGTRLAPEVVLAPAVPARPATAATGPVVTIGNFDGVHRGHRRVLREARSLAERLGTRVVVVTFDRHPATTLRPDAVPPTLTTPEQKEALLKASGADEVVTLTFDAARAAQSAEDFVHELVLGTLRASAVVVGANFRFGHRAAGDLALLERLGAESGVAVRGVDLADGDGEPVSSTRVRRLLGEGKLAAAAELLGRPHVVAGNVREDGTIATAAGLLVPPPGLYLVELAGAGLPATRLHMEVLAPDLLAGAPPGAPVGPCTVTFLAEDAGGSRASAGR